MRFGGLVLVLFVLVGCTAEAPAAPQPSAATTTAAPAPDPAALQARVTEARIPDDAIARLGFQPQGSEEGAGFVVLCPDELATDGDRATVQETHSWTSPGTALQQTIIPYVRDGAAKETVDLARASLECAPIEVDGGTYTPVDELNVVDMRADAQFAMCFHKSDDDTHVCHLLLSKADMLVVLTHVGKTEGLAAMAFAIAGRAAAERLSA
ncbi:hypothetical protein [Saccharothrix hoggarensis]|uniref:PknH-like protein n=1 Tax=Saccharothrix hoggarensis TaxID=913853 RepID=A0ABW3QQ23_9PSEU